MCIADLEGPVSIVVNLGIVHQIVQALQTGEAFFKFPHFFGAPMCPRQTRTSATVIGLMGSGKLKRAYPKSYRTNINLHLTCWRDRHRDLCFSSSFLCLSEI